jgi:hypothetical protein
MLKILRWLGDAIWVYLIPIAVVLNVVQPPLAYLVFGALGALLVMLLAVVLYTLLFGGQVLLSLTQRHTGAPEQHG